jgi:tRNA G18 (ribose-2'-O)-methylase SpoU
LISAANPDQRVPQTIQVESSLHLEVFLDNIRSAFNVGAMLRAADGAGINHMHLAGITPTPDNPKVAKTALGAERSIPWTYHRDGVAAVDELRKRGLRIWAMEGGSRAEPIFQAAGDGNTPTLLVVGNEVSGIDPGILALSEKVVAIPMLGVKNSLNVAVAFGIAVYVLRFSGFVFQSPQPGGLDNS